MRRKSRGREGETRKERKKREEKKGRRQEEGEKGKNWLGKQMTRIQF